MNLLRHQLHCRRQPSISRLSSIVEKMIRGTDTTNHILLLLCYLFTSCTGVGFYIDLGNHYAWLEERMIVKITEEKETSLHFDILIRPQVLNFNYDDKYIIAYQVYDGSPYYDLDYMTEERDSLLIQFEKLKIIKKCYWIVNKDSGLVIGPLRKEEFVNKCKELHVKAIMRRSHEKNFR